MIIYILYSTPFIPKKCVHSSYFFIPKDVFISLITQIIIVLYSQTFVLVINGYRNTL